MNILCVNKTAGTWKGLSLQLELRMEAASVEISAPVTHATANERDPKEKKFVCVQRSLNIIISI